jgi:hypothetical protein
MDDEKLIQEPEVQEEVQQLQQPQESQESKFDYNLQEKNLRALREKSERIERERDEAVRRLQEIEISRQAQTQEDEEFDVSPDDLVDGKHLKKVANKIKSLEDQIKNYQQYSSMMTIEQQIKSQYPDFESVVTKDNLEAFRNSFPEIAATLNADQNLYNKATAAYQMIKKFGINQENNFKADVELAQRNAAKPKPLASVSPQQGESPLTRANAFAQGLTDELRSQLHKEMVEAIKNR